MCQPQRLLDPRAGDWINDQLRIHQGKCGRVASVIPANFSRVARILHPTRDGRSWTQVARDHARTVHPLAQWLSINPNVTGWSRSEADPEQGTLGAELQASIFRHCPDNDLLIYAVWVGWGSWEQVDDTAVMPGWGGRDYYLFTAPQAPQCAWPGMTGVDQSASLIWPADRQWCIATEIDFDSTLVAGNDQLINAILNDTQLEAFEVNFSDDLSYAGDVINPKPTWLNHQI